MYDLKRVNFLFLTLTLWLCHLCQLSLIPLLHLHSYRVHFCLLVQLSNLQNSDSPICPFLHPDNLRHSASHSSQSGHPETQSGHPETQFGHPENQFGQSATLSGHHEPQSGQSGEQLPTFSPYSHTTSSSSSVHPHRTAPLSAIYARTLPPPGSQSPHSDQSQSLPTPKSFSPHVQSSFSNTPLQLLLMIPFICLT